MGGAISYQQPSTVSGKPNQPDLMVRDPLRRNITTRARFTVRWFVVCARTRRSSSAHSSSVNPTTGTVHTLSHPHHHLITRK